MVVIVVGCLGWSHGLGYWFRVCSVTGPFVSEGEAHKYLEVHPQLVPEDVYSESSEKDAEEYSASIEELRAPES